MGHFTHHAVLVTDFGTKDLTTAHKLATDLGLVVTPIVDARMNGVASFAVLPDGSKESRERSEECDRARDQFKGVCGQLNLEWVEVRYGRDDDMAAVTDSAYTAVLEG